MAIRLFHERPILAEGIRGEIARHFRRTCPARVRMSLTRDLPCHTRRRRVRSPSHCRPGRDYTQGKIWSAGDRMIRWLLVRLIERLEEHGFKHLLELIKATGMAAEIRARQRQF